MIQLYGRNDKSSVLKLLRVGGVWKLSVVRLYCLISTKSTMKDSTGSDEMDGGAPLNDVHCAMIPVSEQVTVRNS
jgi:hypothetical protein